MTRKLAIFDLDETLVHATKEPLGHSPSFEHAPYFIYQRPFLAELLAAIAPVYDVAVWSSASREYVDAVANRIFRTEVDLKFVWAIERCVQRVHVPSNSYVYIKDLRKVQSQGYSVEQITIVDDSPEKIARQPRNHLHVSPYLGMPEDRELLKIAAELIHRAQ